MFYSPEIQWVSRITLAPQRWKILTTKCEHGSATISVRVTTLNNYSTVQLCSWYLWKLWCMAKTSAFKDNVWSFIYIFCLPKLFHSMSITGNSIQKLTQLNIKSFNFTKMACSHDTVHWYRTVLGITASPLKMDLALRIRGNILNSLTMTINWNWTQHVCLNVMLTYTKVQNVPVYILVENTNPKTKIYLQTHTSIHAVFFLRHITQEPEKHCR